MQNFLESTTRSLLEGSHAASILTDADGVIHLLNAAAEVLLNIAADDWQGRTLPELLGQSASEGLLNGLATIARGDMAQEQALTVQLGEQVLPLWLSNHPVYAGQRCQGVIWTLRALQNQTVQPAGDLARLQRYHKLFHYAALSQFVMDVADTYSWICAHGVFAEGALQKLLTEQPALLDELRATINPVEANIAARSLLGIAEHADLAEGFQRSASDADVLQAGLLAMAIHRGEEQQEYRHGFVDAAGDQRQLLTVCALPPAQFIDQGVLVSVIDLTELCDVQAELRTRERFLSATLLAVPDLLFVYDFEEDCPLFVNEALQRHLGYDWEYVEALGSAFSAELVHPDDVVPKADLPAYRARLAAGEIFERPVRFRQQDGQWRQFQCRTASLEASRGITRVGVIVARDITEQLEVLERVKQQDHRYKLLAENFSDIICTTDVDLKVTYLSPSVERALGYSVEELPLHNRQLLNSIDVLRDMYAILSRDIAKARRERRQPQLLELELDYLRVIKIELPHKKGQQVSLEVQCSLMWDEAGDLQGLLLVARDISQRTRIEADRRLAAKVFENSLEGIYITDANGKISQINRAFTELTGYSREDALGQRPSILAVESRPVSFAKVIKPILNGAGFWQGELWSRRKNGTEFPTAVGITAVAGKQGEFLGHITSFKDITERKNTEDRIRKLAYFDPLTGLPNRSLFVDRLNQELQAALRSNGHVALLFLDMDRFKSVNDSMGHAAGDLLLGKIAEKLSACVRGNDSIARMGGDEFTIILGGFKERSNAISAAVSVARKVMDVLDEPMVLHGREVFLSASIGIAVYPHDGEDATTLLQHADVAMYNAKQSGSNNFQFYVESMNARALEKLELQNGLYRAAVNHDFRAMYQPIIDLPTGRIIAVETLLRWNHPVRGPISPSEFVPVAEESGLIVRIGQWVLQEACQQMACWLSQGYELEWIAVNISARQFTEGNLVRHVNNALDESALPANYLELELTESILMDDMTYTLQTLNDLKSMGVELAIDDFGTGYSSLSYLKQFPIDRLKIDRAFVNCLPDDIEDQRIIQAILAIAHSFNLSVVAEGIEKQAQLDFLTSHGCEAGQGYLFGKPMSAADLTELLQQSMPRVLDVPAG
jgi:diguanylate cyclase (GGDEF)-like protein/PAS domain S-box-containing protein